MVEELKLAIKVDDDAIEQSLLKQFANAEKMANKVVLTFNNIDLDDKAIEAKFKEMQKMAGKNPIDLSIDKSSIEMLSAISKQLGNIFDIAKGKSIIDSSATVSEINKITQATKELNKAQTGSENIQSKSFTTKNKTEAYNQLKQTADVFKQFYGNEEAMHTKAGTEAAYAYYKAYEEALRKGVAESKLQKVTVDVDKDGFFNAERVSSTRIEEFANFEKYGGEVTALSEEISYFEKRLLKFSDAYSQIQSKLGKAPITPEIIQNIEEYVRNLEIAESRAKDADLMGFTKEDIDIYKDSADMYLGFAIEDAIKENEKYISSLKEVSEEKEKVDVSLNKSQTSDMDSSVVEQQNKIQEELKETQKQAEQTSESLSNIADGNKSNISSENSSTAEAEKYQQITNDTVSVLTDVGKTEDQIIAKIQKERQEAEANNDVLREHLVLLDSAGKVIANHWGSKSNVNGTFTSEQLAQANGGKIIHAHPGKASFFGGKDLQNLIQNSMYDQIKQVELIWGDSTLSVDKSTLTKESSSALLNIMRNVRSKLTEIYSDNQGGTPSQEAREHINAIEKEIFKAVSQKLDISVSEKGTMSQEVVDSLSDIDKAIIKKFRDIESSVVRDINPSDIISSVLPMKDVFQGGTSFAEKLEEEIKNIDSATERASESAKEYKKILSQVGEFDIDSKVSAMYKRNDGQLESWTWRAKKDEEGNVLYDQNGNIDYDEPTITVISKYEQLEKIIVKADNELRNLQKDLAEIKAYDPTASTTNIETKISDQKEYIQLLEQTVKAISQSDEYLLDEQQIIEARNKAAREYALTTGAKQEKTDAKQSASDEKKRLANIEQVNRALNKQQITIDAIEKTYNKTTNPDLDREVSNQQDLAELAQKKLDIQTKINSLQGKERNSANEKEFLELEKLIAEYKELAKYKLKANNPSKQELGGQNLQTLIQVQISNYDKLITKAKKYGDSASDTVEKLKEQRDILSKIGSDGKYSATADQYYASRDTYKVESAALSAFEAETKVIQDYIDAGTKFKSQFDNLSIKPDDQHQFSSWKKQLEDLNIKIAEYKSKVENLSKIDIADEEQIKKAKTEIEELGKSIKETITTMSKTSQSDRGWTQTGVDKLIQRMNDDLKKNSNYTKETKRNIQALIDELNNIPDRPLSEVFNDFSRFKREAHDAKREGKAFFEIFKDKVIYGGAAQLAGMFGFYDVINIFRDGIDTLKEFDDGLTKISYTMDMTKSQLDNLGKSVLDMASDMKSSIDDAMQVAQIYANMQTSAEEIQRLSEPTLILSNLSGFDSSTIADDIQAVTQQFDILAEDSMHIADVYDYISRNIAVDYSKGLNAMAEGLQVAGSTAKQAGLSYEQTASIIAKAVEKTRLEGSQVGNGLKTIMTRLSKVGELSEEVDNETLSQASESLKKVGIEVYNLDGSYREFDIIMGELAGKWDDLTDAEKSNISFNIAATRQTNLLSAVLSNFSDSMQLAEEATNANGSALENQQKYMESFSGHLQSLETEAKIAWLNILDSETLKDGVDLLTGLVKVVGQLVDTFGLLGTAAGIGGIVAGFKNVGINTLVAY